MGEKRQEGSLSKLNIRAHHKDLGASYANEGHDSGAPISCQLLRMTLDRDVCSRSDGLQRGNKGKMGMEDMNSG